MTAIPRVSSAIGKLRERTDSGAWLLITSSFLASIPSGFLTVALPIYLDRVGLHPESIGTLFTVSGLASAVLLVVFGVLADRYGRKLFVVIGTVVPVLSYGILAFSLSHPLLLLAAAVGGVGLAGGMSGALVTSGFNALLAAHSDADARTAVFSAAEMAWVFAMFLGSVLAGTPDVLHAVWGMSYLSAYHVAFLSLAALGLLATAVLLPLQERRQPGTLRMHWLPRRSAGRIARLAVALGAIGLGLGCIVQLLPLWFHLRFHVGEAFLGPWYGVAQVVALVGLTLAAPLTARFGAVRLVTLAQGVACLVLVLVPLSPAPIIAILLWIGRTVTLDASWPVQQAYIMDVVEPDERATASSLTYAAWSVASALTPPLGGALLGAGHYTLPFVLGALCYGAGLVVFWYWFRMVPPLALSDGR